MSFLRPVCITIFIVLVPGLASARGMKDPCTVATAGQCSGMDCAFGADVEMSGGWQRIANCIAPLRNIWRKLGPDTLIPTGDTQSPVRIAAREAIYRAITLKNAAVSTSDDHIRFVPTEQVVQPDLTLRGEVYWLVQLNDLGQPYNGMSQTSLARILYAFAELADNSSYPEARRDAATYAALAEAAVRPVLAPVESGGLASIAPCAADRSLRCAWFHSVTRKDIPSTDGATLNQNLHVIRDLVLIDRMLNKRGMRPPPTFDQGIEEGINQLFLSHGHVAVGQAPNFADFMASAGNGPSWAYYGFNPNKEQSEGAYFLRENGKNCSYHYHVLDLMTAILIMTEKAQAAPQARVKALACDSPLRRMYEAAAGSSPPPETTLSASGTWCPAKVKRGSEKTFSFLQNTFSQCSAPR